MRWMLLVLIAAALACASCANDKVSSGATGTGPEKLPGQTPVVMPPPAVAQSNGRGPIAASTAGPIAAKRNVGNLNDIPAPPKDAQFTIYCDDYTGDSHVALANHAKSAMIQHTGKKTWYCIHQQDHSTLFYGYYKEANDPQAIQDLNGIRAMKDQFGGAIFHNVLLVSVDAPDPTAPAEWNLANLRQGLDDDKHYWTIQIAAYKDSPQRKQAAIEAVKAAREQGIEAYYYHGDSVSSVCVGCWPQGAIRIEGADELKGVSADNADFDSQLMVAPGFQLDDRVRRAMTKKNVSVVQPKVQIVDQRMIDMKERFPDHAVNGVVSLVTTSDGSKHPHPSIVVQIPVKVTTGIAAGIGGPNAPADQAPPSEALKTILPDTKAPSGPGTGRLKSVGK